MKKRRLIKRLVMPAAVVAALSVPAPESKAILGSGIVFDPTAFAESIVQTANQVQQIANQVQGLANQAQQLVNQVQQIELAIQSLENLDFSSFGAILSSLQRLRATYANIDNRVTWIQGTGIDFIDNAYPEVHDSIVSAFNLDAFSEHVMNRLLNSRDTARSSADLAGETFAESEERKIEAAAILDASSNAPGQTAAIQASTELLGSVLAELQSMHYTALAAERRAATQSLDEVDEAILAQQVRDEFFSDADTEFPTFNAEIPTR